MLLRNKKKIYLFNNCLYVVLCVCFVLDIMNSIINPVRTTHQSYLEQASAEELLAQGIVDYSIEEDYLVVDESWILSNLYKVSTYKDNKDGTWTVSLIRVQEATDSTWEELQELFYNTPYSLTNSYCLEDGVNCQGMTVYLADWCEKNGCPFSVKYSSSHVYIVISYEGYDYEFNFNITPRITNLGVSGD